MLHEVAEQELARRRLLDFAVRVSPGFQTPPHIQLLADRLERVERGEIKKLMFNVPVRTGKSKIGSQVFPAWYIGRHPNLDVILASHSEDLASRNSRIAKSFVQDERWPFNVRLASDSTSVGRWNTTAAGGCYAIGVGGAITGRGANLLVIDDALHDGLSEAESASAWRWYSEVAVPRLEPGGAIIMIGARLSPTDLCGRILESEDGPNWHVVNLPAIAGEDDVLGREPGEALWPERFGIAELEQRRVSMGSRAFAAQFQQDPVPLGGDLVKASWLENRYKKLPADLEITASLDAATKTGLTNDWSVIVVLGTSDNAYYVVDVIRRKVDYPDLRRMVEQASDIHQPSRVFVEDASNGSPLIQTLRRESRMPIIGVPPSGSKIARFEAISGLLEAGRVWLPLDAPWMDAFMRELLAFPGGRHDDQVDALVLGLSQISNRGQIFAFYM